MLARIADSNANRAREGLRVVEDLARIGGHNAALARRFRVLRRDITSGIQKNSKYQLLGKFLEARDTTRDPAGGGARESQGRLARRGILDMAASNLRRTQESLRVLEEIDRVLGGSGRGFRGLRFRAYKMEGDMLRFLDKRRIK